MDALTEAPAQTTKDRPGRGRFRGFGLLWPASILVPLAIFAAAAIWSRNTVEEETRERLTRTVDMLHEHALRSMETQEAILEAVDRRIQGMSWDEIRQSRPLHEFLSAITRQAQPSGGLVVVSPEDKLAAGSFAFGAGAIDVSDRDYVRVHRAGDAGTYIGEVVAARPQGTVLFSVSRRRSREGAAYDGAIVSSFKPSYFEDFYRTVAETPDDVVALVREDGALLARSPPPSRVEDYAGRHGPLFQQARQNERIILRGRSPLDRQERLYAFRRVGDYPVFVTYGLSPAVIRRAWFEQLALYGIITGLAAAALLLLTAHAQRAVSRERAALAAARGEAERRADAEARLRHAQRVDALGQIVGGVAHDFNNVVMAVMAGTRRIARRAEEPAEIRRVVGLIDAAAERGARLTQRMLAFARAEETRTGIVEVGPALDSVAELLGHTLGSGYRVELQRPQSLPVAKGDRSDFETAIVNLVINARDAMPEGGTVTVTAAEETVALSGPSHAPGLEPGHYVRVGVGDRGTGMDSATLARAGEAFFTTKEPGKGTGLGLAMARAFTEQAGGSLRIDSEPGRGTTVTLWLAAAT